MSSSPPAALPELPTFPPSVAAASSSVPPAQESSAAPGATNQQVSLLYNTQPAPDYILRPFEQKHDRQTIYIDARKAGAVDALIELVAEGNKTKLVEMMINDILTKYESELQ